MIHYKILNSDEKSEVYLTPRNSASIFAISVIFIFVFAMAILTSGDFSFGFVAQSSSTELIAVEDILEASFQPNIDGKSIFFIETTNHKDKILNLTPRQACSIESAGKFFSLTFSNENLTLNCFLTT